MTETYQKVIVPTSLFGHQAYADYFSLDGDPNAPFVVFFGGTISPYKYHERERDKPENLINYFKNACKNKTKANLLTVPCPYGNIADKHRPLFCMKSLLDELFSKIESNQDVRSFIGNSMGCYWAAGLINEFPNLNTIVTIAGAQMDSAIRERPPDRWPSIVHCFSNEQDYLMLCTLEFIRTLKKNNVPRTLSIREGDHLFADYEKNGSAEDAFYFATKHL